MNKKENKTVIEKEKIWITLYFLKLTKNILKSA